MRTISHCANHPLHEVQVAEAAGATIALHHLLYRTTEVDVHEVRLEDLSNHHGSFAHPVRIGTENLDADRVLARVEAEFAHGSRILAANAFCREEFRYHHVGAIPAAETPEWRLGHACHGCQKNRDYSPVGGIWEAHPRKLTRAEKRCNAKV